MGWLFGKSKKKSKETSDIAPDVKPPPKTTSKQILSQSEKALEEGKKQIENLQLNLKKATFEYEKLGQEYIDLKRKNGSKETLNQLMRQIQKKKQYKTDISKKIYSIEENVDMLQKTVFQKDTSETIISIVAAINDLVTEEDMERYRQVNEDVQDAHAKLREMEQLGNISLNQYDDFAFEELERELEAEFGEKKSDTELEDEIMKEFGGKTETAQPSVADNDLDDLEKELMAEFNEKTPQLA